MNLLPKNKKIFVIDDEPGMLRYIRTLLELEGLEVQTAEDPVAALATLTSGKYTPDLIFLDLLMPQMDGLQVLEHIRKLDRKLRVVILSCISDTAKVVEAMRLGALDYVNKPFDQNAVYTVIQRYCSDAIGKDLGSCEVTELPDGGFFLVGSDEMRRIRAEVELIAQVDIPVLILGESGVGKEVVAQLIRERSERASKAYMKINCAALPGDLLESELFGYEAGAFTGANKAKAGKFELCDGGILFLDEIGELPVQLQAKLLHVLQDGEFARLGGRASKRVNVRVIAATNIDVTKNIANKTLREDLYYRLAAFSISLPPLRARKQEIPMLLKHMMSRLSESYGRPAVELTPRLIDACCAYSWPGNVRELNNFVKRLLVLRDEETAVEELQITQSKPAPVEPAADLLVSPGAELRRREAESILQAIERCNGNKRLAASSLKMSYNVFLQKEKEYNLRSKRLLESR